MLPRLHVTRCCLCPALAMGACLPPAAAMKPQLLKLMLHAAPALPFTCRATQPSTPKHVFWVFSSTAFRQLLSSSRKAFPATAGTATALCC